MSDLTPDLNVYWTLICGACSHLKRYYLAWSFPWGGHHCQNPATLTRFALACRASRFHFTLATLLQFAPFELTKRWGVELS